MLQLQWWILYGNIGAAGSRTTLCIFLEERLIKVFVSIFLIYQNFLFQYTEVENQNPMKDSEKGHVGTLMW